MTEEPCNAGSALLLSEWETEAKEFQLSTSSQVSQDASRILSLISEVRRLQAQVKIPRSLESYQDQLEVILGFRSELNKYEGHLDSLEVLIDVGSKEEK